MIHQLIDGFEATELHDDQSQLEFGFHCLDAAYASLKETFQAQASLKDGQEFQIKVGKALGIVSKNDQIIKFAQKAGFMLVIRKDPEDGDIRIKARPDAALDLKALHEAILKIDQENLVT